MEPTLETMRALEPLVIKIASAVLGTFFFYLLVCGDSDTEAGKKVKEAKRSLSSGIMGTVSALFVLFLVYRS